MEFTTALILGLVGSLHCAGMCGPLAVAVPASGSSRTSFLLGRVAYNGGRLFTYSILGALFGSIGKTLALAGLQRGVSISLGILLIAGLLASRRMALSRPITFLVNRIKGPMSALLRRRTFSALALLGLLNGLLPCGLVYVACAGAAALGGVLGGALYMTVFGLGTVPMMLAIGLSGRLVPIPLRLKLARLIPVSIFLLATLLIIRGLGLGIPYLSPDLSTGGLCCTH